ncbi:hypothetical protein PHMEG_00036005 [Phytophthora megakarya]|uniref:Uncharacterized protein n=1 Tax=Phytophthora megakarya TaxID=4795 RepID=A0A225UMU4_9STRA|nr:hypothetical protein PHMEG_00036005 [Phytophthora megakarya]
MSASGIDWELLSLGPDHSGLLRLLPPSSTAELSDDDGLDSSFDEASSALPVALSGSGASADESSEHSFIRPAATSPSLTLPAIDVPFGDGGGLFDDEQPNVSRPKRRRLRQYTSEPKAAPAASKLPVSRRLGRPSVSLKKRSQPAAVTPKPRSGHKKARLLPASSTDVSPPAKKLRSPPASTVTDGCIDDDMGGELAVEATIVEAKPGTGDNLLSRMFRPLQVLDLTSDDVVTSLPGKDSSPFSSPVVSFFPRKDGRPRTSSSVASELRMRESLEKELADDDFMLGLTAEGSVAGTMDSVPSKEGSRNPVSLSDAAGEVSADSSAGDDHQAPAGEGSVVEAPAEAGALVGDIPASESSVDGAPGLGVVDSPSPLPPVSKPGSVSAPQRCEF